MIEIRNWNVTGWEHAIHGMRNPINSWERMDSKMMLEANPKESEWWEVAKIGKNDHELMMRLSKGGSVHAKYRRMIALYVDVLAPLYWWKEFDTYKVGTVANSCSTMHKIQSKEFVFDDFSHEHLNETGKETLKRVIWNLNVARSQFLATKNKDDWWQMIQLLPSSYNQMRTLMMNYEVLSAIYSQRKDHKLDEWRTVCRWIQTLPYSEIMIGGEHA